mgnify:CR=1 FL=1
MNNLKATIQAAAEVTGTVSAGGGGTVDQTFSSTSKNAQSGVAIAGELEKYQPKLIFDTTPKNGSNNPVTSKGVYSALLRKVNSVNGKSLSTNDYTDAEKQKNADNAASIATLNLNKADNSALLEYVKSTDYASADGAGIVQIDIKRGIGIVPTDHKLYVNTLITTDISNRTDTIGVLTMALLNHAVKAALTDDKRITDMTESEKINARGVIGAESKPYIIYHANPGGVSLYDREDHRISSNVTPIILVVPSSIGADYECCFSFQSGETATTLTYPGDTIKFVGVDCDENGDFIPTANKNYEVIIKNLATDGATPVLVARVGVY